MIWISESFAKINLGLHVLERLPTGFHRIETGLCFIEWKDRFEVKEADQFSLSLNEPSIPNGEENLITKAYRSFEKYIGLNQHYSFHIDKQIPPGAGLGGGSSNAALTLRMLNKLEKTGLSDEELTDLSRTLGSDIAFFLYGKPALATGMGQDLEPMGLQPSAWIVTIYPGFESSTATVYQRV
ncbi:MAG: 4-(cytidine 5'-diphospho)-2-C-methyl-D-erythritol kinase, partial [Balneolaceae bacterium]